MAARKSMLIATAIQTFLSVATPVFAQDAETPQAATPPAYDPWVVGETDTNRGDVIYTDAIPTPHRAWAKPYYQGKIKALLVPNLVTGREAVELSERMDLEYDTISMMQEGDVSAWGLGDVMGARARGTDVSYNALAGRLDEKPYEVMVIAGFDWSRIPATLREKILKAVQEGMGLVVMAAPQSGKQPLPEPIRDMLVLNGASNDPNGKGPWKLAGRHYITDGQPIETVSKKVENSVYSFSDIRGGQTIVVGPGNMPVLSCQEVGKGRVCAYGYAAPWAMPGFTPSKNGDQYEYFYSLLLKSILWAAHKNAPVETVTFDSAGAKLAVSFNAKLELRQPQVELAIWDAENTLIRRETQTVKAGDPCAASFNKPGDLAGGLHFATFTLRAGGKVIDWWTTAFEVPRDVTVEKVEAVKGAGGEVAGAVTLGGDGQAASVLEIELLDSNRRVMERKIENLPPGKQALREFRFKSDNVTTILAYVRATVRQSGRQVDRSHAPSIIIAPPQDSSAFKVGSYGRMTSSFRDYLRPTYYARLKEVGIDSLLPSEDWRATLGYPYDMGFKASATIGSPWLGYYATVKQPLIDAMAAYKKTKDKKYLIRTSGCLNDPAVLAKMKDVLTKALKPKLPYGQHLWDVGGECSLTSYTDPGDFCFCDLCLKDYRVWLQQQYPSLAALNASWGTTNATWDAVVPMTAGEAQEHFKTAQSFGPWFDHRTYMEVVWARTFKKIDSWVKELDPAGAIGINGTQASTAYNGNDWWRLDSIFGGLEPYDVGAQYELHRSFNPNLKLTLWTGYGARGVGAGYGIWNGIFHGFHGVNIFWDFEILNPDYTCSKSGRDIGKALQEIKQGGIGYLLNNCQRQDDPIAVLYSMASIHAGIHVGVIGDYLHTDHLSALSGVCRLIAESGHQFRVISYEQLANGELQKQGYKVLALPCCLAMSKAETDAVDAFVKAGGTLLAWPVAAIMDEHGKMYPKPPLQNLLGIEVKKALPATPFEAVKNAPQVEAANVIIGPVKQGWDYVIMPTTAKVLATTTHFKHAMPLATCSEYGKGKAYYLTCRTADVDGTFEFDTKTGTNNALRMYLIGLVDRACADAGLVKRMTVANADGSLAEKYASYFFEHGAIQYNILLPTYLGKKTIGLDGVSYMKDPDGNPAQTYRVSFPQAWHVYEVRQGKYLGEVKQFDEQIAFGSPRIYACLPYKVEAVTAKAPAQAAHPGQTVELAIGLAVSGNQTPGDHVVRLSVTLPSGQSAPYLDKMLSLTKGAGQVKIPLALNDPAGRWTVEVTDVTTGLKGTTAFDVQP